MNLENILDNTLVNHFETNDSLFNKGAVFGNRDSSDPYHLTKIPNKDTHLTNESMNHGNPLRNFKNLETKMVDITEGQLQMDIMRDICSPPPLEPDLPALNSNLAPPPEMNNPLY